MRSRDVHFVRGTFLARAPHAAARPASSHRPAASRRRVNRLARETSASFVAFDILARGEENYTQRPFAECRAPLVETWQLRNRRSISRRRLRIAPWRGSGSNSSRARVWTASSPSRLTAPTNPTSASCARSSTRTADCVVAGCRVQVKDTEGIGSLLLGLYTDDGVLQSVGVVGAWAE